MPSFWYTWRRWYSTVFGLRNSAAAVSRVVLPAVKSEEAFTTIGDLLGESIAPPQVSAALYRAAALIPGVTVVANATDAIGRHGVAVAFTYQDTRTEWIFSKQTLQYLGGRDINLANGSTTGEATVLQRAFVDHPGQLPG
jgi:hypothetical protein